MPRTDVILRRIGMTKEKMYVYMAENHPELVQKVPYWRLEDMEREMKNPSFYLYQSFISSNDRVRMIIFIDLWLRDHGVKYIPMKVWHMTIQEWEEVCRRNGLERLLD